MNNNIFNMDLTRTLPLALKQDKTMQVLSQVIAEELQENARLIRNNIIYARIDELPEKLLDILAYDFHVDWYSYDYPVQVKKELIKTSIKVHRKMGTVYAVETAMRAIYPESRIEEWFDYGGEPFHFKIILNAGDNNVRIDIYDIIKKVNLYKRLSAHLDSIHIEKTKKTSINTASSKEIFIKASIKINPYHKEVKRRIGIRVVGAGIVYVKAYYSIFRVTTK